MQKQIRRGRLGLYLKRVRFQTTGGFLDLSSTFIQEGVYGRLFLVFSGGANARKTNQTEQEIATLLQYPQASFYPTATLQPTLAVRTVVLSEKLGKSATVVRLYSPRPSLCC